MHDLIIIGAGPAGLTAALYAGRSRLKTLVLEKALAGGRILMSETIENFPGFPGGVSTHELIERMVKQVEELGVKIEADEALELDSKGKIVKTASATYQAKAVIVASGAKPRKLAVPGEEKLAGRGVSYCAPCDGPLYRGKDVVIIGGGNAVAEEALYLSRLSNSVNIVHRRQDLRASAVLQEKLNENKKINFILNHIVTEITGADKVESVKIKDVNSGTERNMSCDGVFIYVGYEPDTFFAKGRLQMDEAGFIITDQGLATSEEGIFACGDCIKKTLYQMITACGEGAIAADSAEKYLSRTGKIA